MTYQHRLDNSPSSLPVGKVVCVGRNYAEHARELNNPIPDEPLLFIKPSTSLVDMRQPIQLRADRGPVHYETELAILIGQPLTRAQPDQVAAAIAGVGLALDLTLRERQSQLKQLGQPWEVAKAFDGSCPLSPFVPLAAIDDLGDCRLQLEIDEVLRQDDSSAQMLTPVLALIAFISGHFTLLPGDVVLTGTPAGVGVLKPGMQLRLRLDQVLSLETSVQG
ncbi:MAG: 2-keto-4-pentenoate hydratase/2-oxohepta-3-ene-1,7-dioic acid hydratase in catechol pathway [Motiliproteus sp.]|jgi:2-keto-4-pentenoate hydratase/2-oxohepta-3-ene-1,7-dioic acid hydratase in catechol pathway